MICTNCSPRKCYRRTRWEQQAKLVQQHTQQILALRTKTRVDNLVSAIGEFIRGLPPQQ